MSATSASPGSSQAPELSPAAEVSFVIPCLNEEASIALVVRQAHDALVQLDVPGEVVVVDNGSEDRSAELARAAGARVVTEPRRGYGSAYLAGLAAARGRYLVLTDADATYDLARLPEFLDALRSGNDLVLGSRFRGTIMPGSMPWSHRWIGNPVLTGMLNLLFRAGVSDAHCGLRALRREALATLQLQSTGMEFASEMVIKAAKRGLRITEIPIVYRPREGESKLNSVATHGVTCGSCSSTPPPSSSWCPGLFSSSADSPCSSRSPSTGTSARPSGQSRSPSCPAS